MEVKVEGEKVTITFMLTDTAGMTGNGNVLVASTRGWKPVAPGVSVSMNVVRKL